MIRLSAYVRACVCACVCLGCWVLVRKRTVKCIALLQSLLISVSLLTLWCDQEAEVSQKPCFPKTWPSHWYKQCFPVSRYTLTKAHIYSAKCLLLSLMSPTNRSGVRMFPEAVWLALRAQMHIIVRMEECKRHALHFQNHFHAYNS